ncbi:MAG: hypothetical protein IJX98_04090 [Clostridia bacterium]|nr:hypothetical protein [Clostridia bacterium]
MNGKGKRSLFRLLALTLCGAAAGLSACTLPISNCLAEPTEAQTLAWSDYGAEEFTSFRQKADGFAAAFAEAAKTERGNFTVSPASVFMGLSLAAECAAGQTREELLSVLGVSYEELTNNIGTLYRALNREHKTNATVGNNVRGLLKTTNSVWLAEGVSFRRECIDRLASDYYCYSYSADFAGKNANANQAVRDFVKEQTNGLIDRAFDISEETLFTLVNTLYLKDVWNTYGDDIAMTSVAYEFANANGSTKSVKLLQDGYIGGRAYESERFTYFFATTYHGYQIKFMLPKDGYAASEIFTKENLAEMNAVQDFGAVDEENRIKYYTRCLFPEYTASYDENIKSVLQSLGVETLFDVRCDLSSLTDDGAYCGEVRHITNLKVDRKGIEGAAVTVIPGAGAPGPDDYEEVYEDFVVDRAFAFLITDPYDITLFSGVVNEI